MSTDFTDDQLIQRFKIGEESALSRLDARYREGIIKSLSRFVPRDVAEDLYQESLLKATQRIDTFRSGNFRAWLYQIARNRCIDYLRRQKRLESVDWSEVPEEVSDDPAHQLETREIQEKIDREIAALPPRQQAVTRLRLYDELKFSQIAEVIGGNPRSIKALFHHARRRLQERVSLYLSSICLPFQHLFRLDGLFTTIAKPAIALTAVAMTTFIASDDAPQVKPTVQYAVDTSNRWRSVLHLNSKPVDNQSVSQTIAEVEYSPIALAVAVDVPHSMTVVALHPPSALLDEPPSPTISTVSTLPGQTYRFDPTKRGQQVASPVTGLDRSISIPGSKVATITDAIPDLDLDSAKHPLLNSREPGGCITNR